MIVTKDHADKLSRTIEATGLAQPVNATFSENRVQILCRVASGNEDKWVNLIRALLESELDEHAQVHAWKSHICRNYFIKEDPTSHSRKLVWGWSISIHSPEMALSLNAIVKIARGEPIRMVGSSKELTEFPLHGATAQRNALKGGKGVHTIGGSNGDFSPGRK